MNAFLLRSPGDYSCVEKELPSPGPGELRLKLAACAICRTDAKLCLEGHRDLSLPRIPGHELSAFDEASGKLFAVWPGSACGSCDACLRGAENLCAQMRIVGFHRDGGFADYICVQKDALIPLSEALEPGLACLAEPLACVLNALARLELADKKILIVGAGPLGLMAALSAKELGAKPLLLERNPEKIRKCTPFCEAAKINIREQATNEKFHLALNATGGLDAFSSALEALQPGGSLVFFSGLPAQEELPARILNEIHYRELNLLGAYGCTRAGMRAALGMLSAAPSLFSLLIEKRISLAELSALLPKISDGMHLKIIVEFKND